MFTDFSATRDSLRTHLAANPNIVKAFLRLLPRYRAAFDESIAQVRAATGELYTTLCQRPAFASRAENQRLVAALDDVLARTAAATEQLDNLASLLRRRGIQVDRPEPVDFSQPVSTPLWTTPQLPDETAVKPR